VSSILTDLFQIFTEKRKEGQLPPEKVLAHIKLTAPALTLPYLEFVVHDMKDASADFHNELIFLYLDTVLAIRRDAPRMFFLLSLAAHSVVVADAQRVVAGTEGGLLGETRRKLISFLETSQHYTPEKMLSRFPFNGNAARTQVLRN
jgi:hypothetical protein